MIVVDAAAAVRRTLQAWYEFGSQQENLACGIVFHSDEWPAAPELNQFREVQLTDTTIDDAWTQAEAAFAKRDRRCARWVPAGDQSPEAFEPFLKGRGFKRVDLSAMLLTQWPDGRDVDGVRLLPVRTVLAKYDALIGTEDDARRDPSAYSVAARIHIDDPQLEQMIALHDGQPAGTAGLYQVGDIACLRDVFVRPEFRRRGIGRQLVCHLLAVARRLTPRAICTFADVAEPTAVPSLHRCGFQAGGTITEFHRTAANAIAR